MRRHRALGTGGYFLPGLLRPGVQVHGGNEDGKGSPESEYRIEKGKIFIVPVLRAIPLRDKFRNEFLCKGE